MIDLILFIFVLITFILGFWAGFYVAKTYGSVGKALEALGKYISEKKEKTGE